MTQSFAQAQAAVAELVERFRRNLDIYRRAEYKEAEVRHEFIEPLFDALGWDVYNRNGYAEQYKDVVHEESLRVAAGIEAPDYTFRIGGVRKFLKESVLRGSFDRYAESVKGKRGTSEVDAEFLKEIEGWREVLARNLALRNPRLNVHELNYA